MDYRFTIIFFNFVKKLMPNPFEKYLGKEDKLQHAVMRYINVKYPNALCSHISNEGKRSPFERFKMKYLGAKAGIPDVMIFTPNDHYSGLAIELKTGYNKPSDNQLKWLRSLRKANWKTFWAKDFETITTTIDKYFNNEQE